MTVFWFTAIILQLQSLRTFVWTRFSFPNKHFWRVDDATKRNLWVKGLPLFRGDHHSCLVDTCSILLWPSSMVAALWGCAFWLYSHACWFPLVFYRGLLACCRGLQLEESLEYLQFMENAEEEETWINEKEAMVARGDSGDTLAATQVSNRLNESIFFSLRWIFS